LNQTIDDGKSYLSKEQVNRKQCLTEEKLLELINNIDGGVKIAYPMGLPDYDPITQILLPDYTHKEMLEPEKTSMWFAGKEIHRDQKLYETKSIGRNEKTTIIVKLTKRGSGPPARENPITEDEQKRLMAYYYRKQEEQKKLQEDEDDNYTNSSWANPKTLKHQFQGISNVNWK
jgi:hypothetical protein